MKISSFIKSEILNGNAILFLGAGASIPSFSKDGIKKGLSGNQLRDALSDQFLGGASKSKSLSHVSSLAFNQAGTSNVHDFIFNLVDELEPTKAHELITKFRWKAIITTNYDRVVEKTYERSSETQQKLKRVISNSDSIQKIVSDPQNLPYLKIHGCVTRLNDPHLPLILSGENYYKFRDNRDSLFNQLKEWAVNYPIIFCGYSIADENIRDLIMDVEDNNIHRPMYIFIDPFIEDVEIQYWSNRRFECHKTDLEGFMTSLIESIPNKVLTLSSAFSEGNSSITKLIPSHERPSIALVEYLKEKLIHINQDINFSDTISAERFYKGYSEGFSWIKSSYDVYRNITDILLEDIFNDGKKNGIYLLSGYAGSGKTIILKQFSWNACLKRNGNVFYLDEGGIIEIDEIIELAKLINEQIVIVIDDILDHKDEIIDLYKTILNLDLNLKILTTTRVNEWNIAGNNLEPLVSSQYDVLDMDDNEVNGLLDKLTKNNLLGVLKEIEPAERIHYLKSKLRNQLLVALHEVTEGKSFEQIIIDEYNNISPRQAKDLYLDICTLNRFRIKIRAGLLSRISGITFYDFKESFYKPLELVVRSFIDRKYGDYVYVSRHDRIAEIVFNNAFESPDEKSYQLVKIIRYLNSGYDTDRQAIEYLIKGRLLADSFADKKLAVNIFKAAEEAKVPRHFLLHQQAVYELHHQGGDINYALKLIEESESCAPKHVLKSIQHTKANVYRRLAHLETELAEKTALRDKAIALLSQAITKRPKDSMAHSLKAKLLLEELKDFVETVDIEDQSKLRVLDSLTKDIELNFKSARELFPDDADMLNNEAEFSKFMQDMPRALSILEKAYKTNKTNLFISLRLARHYFYQQDQREEGLKIVRTTILAHPTSKEAHFELAKMLIDINELSYREEISRALKRSYTFGDSNIEAQFKDARFEFLHGDKTKSLRIFNSLAKYNLLPSSKTKVRDRILDSHNTPKIFYGKIERLHDSFAFINCLDFPDNIYAHVTSMSSYEDWQSLKNNISVKFTVGFNYKGVAIHSLWII